MNIPRVTLRLGLIAIILGSANNGGAVPYLVAQLGASNIDVDPIDGSDTYLALGLGFEVNDFLAFELAYNDFGEVSQKLLSDEIKADATSFSASAIGRWQLNSSVSLYIKIGLDLWDLELKSVFFEEEEDGADLFFGIGGGYDINLQTVVHAEYQVHKFDNADVTAFAVGLRVKF